MRKRPPKGFVPKAMHNRLVRLNTKNEPVVGRITTIGQNPVKELSGHSGYRGGTKEVRILVDTGGLLP